jgi:hypothetical protein
MGSPYRRLPMGPKRFQLQEAPDPEEREQIEQWRKSIGHWTYWMAQGQVEATNQAPAPKVRGAASSPPQFQRR